MMKKYIMLLFSAATLLVTGCDYTGYGGFACPDEVSVTVQMEAQPVFSWDPACSAYIFEIFALSPEGFIGHTVWELEARDGAPSINPPILPPLTYSVKPEDIDQPTPAIPLEKGRRYRVWVTSSINYKREVVGKTEFIYTP
jgi:hypothetical protein